jgi:Flp pilus assembly protein TadG
MALLSRLKASRSGAAAVEFALICSLFFSIVLGIFNLGWSLYCGADVRHGIERASRIYLTTPNATDSQFRSRAASYLEVTNISAVGTTVTRESVAGGRASVVRVAWTYSCGLSIPFIQASTFNFGGQVVVPLAAT